MAAVEQPAEPRQLVIFRVAETHYALGIEVVDEILPVLPVTPLPGAPGGVLGLADVRKRVVPVFDLHWKFGGQATETTTRGSSLSKRPAVRSRCWSMPSKRSGP